MGDWKQKFKLVLRKLSYENVLKLPANSSQLISDPLYG